MSEENALIPMKKFQDLAPQDLFEKGDLKKVALEIIENVKSIVIDPATNPKWMEETKSLAYKVAQTKTHIDKCRKIYIEDKQRFIKSVNASCAEVVDMLQDLQDQIRKPVTEFEEKEKARVAGIKLRISMIESYKQFNGMTEIKSIEMALKEVDLFDPLSTEEFAHTADRVKKEVFNHLSGVLLLAEDFAEKEAQRVRLEQEDRERKEKERIQKIEQDAKDKAEMDAQKAIKDAEDKARAEAQAKLDEQDRQHKLELKRIADEKRQEEEAREKERREQEAIQLAEQKRLEDVEHKRSVNKSIQLFMVSMGASEEVAMDIVRGILTGKSPANISIKY